jgi:hypothetical protein
MRIEDVERDAPNKESFALAPPPLLLSLQQTAPISSSSKTYMFGFGRLWCLPREKRDGKKVERRRQDKVLPAAFDVEVESQRRTAKDGDDDV